MISILQFFVCENKICLYYNKIRARDCEIKEGLYVVEQIMCTCGSFPKRLNEEEYKKIKLGFSVNKENNKRG